MSIEPKHHLKMQR